MDVSVNAANDPRERELASMLPVYGQLPFVPVAGEGCEIITADGRRILDLYGGHAVAALGYGHPALTAAVAEQAATLVFQSNAVALEVRARAAELLLECAPRALGRVFLVNSGAEANENALRMALKATGRRRILAVTHGFHGRTAAAGAATWGSERWYGFPGRPFDIDFIERDNCDSAAGLVNADVAAVIVEPVQGVAGAFDLSGEFLNTLRELTRRHGALLIADEVQSGMGRSGEFFAMQRFGVEPDILTAAKSLGGGIPCGAVLCTEDVGRHFGAGDLGSTFGGCPVASAAIATVIETIGREDLLANVRRREQEIRATCITGPVRSVRGLGLLLGLVCDRPAAEVRDRLLQEDILVGTSADPAVVRILAPLTLEAAHVGRLSRALRLIGATRSAPVTE
jgi:acetylornithine/N-succinyldiaminopimelate aminotransferase